MSGFYLYLYSLFNNSVLRMYTFRTMILYRTNYSGRTWIFDLVRTFLSSTSHTFEKISKAQYNNCKDNDNLKYTS